MRNKKYKTLTLEERTAYIAGLLGIASSVEGEGPKCLSCGIPYRDHLGLVGTCKKLQEIFALAQAHVDWQYYDLDSASMNTLREILELKGSN